MFQHPYAHAQVNEHEENTFAPAVGQTFYVNSRYQKRNKNSPCFDRIILILKRWAYSLVYFLGLLGNRFMTLFLVDIIWCIVSLYFYKNKLRLDLVVDSDEIRNIRIHFRANLEKRNTN